MHCACMDRDVAIVSGNFKLITFMFWTILVVYGPAQFPRGFLPNYDINILQVKAPNYKNPFEDQRARLVSFLINSDANQSRESVARGALGIIFHVAVLRAKKETNEGDRPHKGRSERLIVIL